MAAMMLSAHSAQCCARPSASHRAPSVSLSAAPARRAIAFSAQRRSSSKLRSAEVDAPTAEAPDGSMGSNWAAEELAALELNVERAPPAEYSLSFLWLDRNVAVAADQVFSGTQRAPMTEYFFWPKKDAWEELKAALEARPWVSERDRVLLLNRTTEVINYWQQEGEASADGGAASKHPLSDARTKFPDCKFLGSSS